MTPRGKRIAVIGTGSSGVQIAAALSAEAASLDVYQRTPAWVLPKIDFDIPPLMRRILRLPGVCRGRQRCRTAGDGRRHGRADRARLLPAARTGCWFALMPLYDAYCRALYRLLLRATVRDPATREALVPRYGIMAKRPVISSAFLPRAEQSEHPSDHHADRADHPRRRAHRRRRRPSRRPAGAGHRLRTVDRPRDLPTGNGPGRQRFRPRRVLPRPRLAQLRRHRPSPAAQPVGDRRPARLRRLRLVRLRRDHGRARGAGHRRDPAPRHPGRRGQPGRVHPVERR